MRNSLIRRAMVVAILLASAAAAWPASLPSVPTPPGEAKALATAYFRYLLSQQIPDQARSMLAGAPPDCAAVVEDAMVSWSSSVVRRVRGELEAQFGENARDRLEDFVSQFTTAESKADPAFLKWMAAQPGLSPAATNYAGLRQAITATWMKEDVAMASRLMGEIQTWLEVKKRNKDAPPLAAWLNRGQHAPPRSTPTPSATLSQAEAPPPEMAGPDAQEPATPLDTFAAMRKEKRGKAHEQAQAGMQQVATERESWEQEYGQKKLALAQAEAENMKKQAEALVQAEKDALEERKNGWAQRLKTILGSTISAATGAFTGTVGQEAAQRAADALFKEEHTR